jgi:hypothetical protein
MEHIHSRAQFMKSDLRALKEEHQLESYRPILEHVVRMAKLSVVNTAAMTEETQFLLDIQNYLTPIPEKRRAMCISYILTRLRIIFPDIVIVYRPDQTGIYFDWL